MYSLSTRRQYQPRNTKSGVCRSTFSLVKERGEAGLPHTPNPRYFLVGLLAGDFRMYFGENPDKVKNIVSATLGRFQNLYEPALKV